jgi:hypothetical protein
MIWKKKTFEIWQIWVIFLEGILWVFITSRLFIISISIFLYVEGALHFSFLEIFVIIFFFHDNGHKYFIYILLLLLFFFPRKLN